MRHYIEGIAARGTSRIVLQGLRLGDSGIKELALWLCTGAASHIRTLDLTGNHISAKGARYLAEAIQEHTALEYIALGVNSLGPEGAQFLANALPSAGPLRYLDLWCNNLGGVGQMHLAQALEDDRSCELEDLRLGANMGSDEGGRFLAEALKVNSRLRRLDLTLNGLGPDGALYLADALRENTALTDLRLGGNNIGECGTLMLLNALREGKGALQNVELFGNGAKDRTVKGINRICRINRRCVDDPTGYWQCCRKYGKRYHEEQVG
eukprot:gnl/MRDRNA2_/MRDRNA2_166220_c0_seq1.p1 gnl/MRDRNA2_/MRDRNA2_166220_c0~~gnl/MRDRNA2_/MRDRNA2_166220_c0_seq1.p1  ORF type:complete len:267 (+),score=54.84 gnl/MRDRNA2_/MRDRNA2_166220_c0_seq1:95-895(+)